jgi:hypothetical protein
MLPALLAMFQARAYEFVSLEKAMSDPIYQTPDVYTGRKGRSWIHRWGLALGDPIQMEPDEPIWIDELAKE